MKKVINMIQHNLSQIPQKTQNNLPQSGLRDLQLATRAIPQRKNRKKSVRSAKSARE